MLRALVWKEWRQLALVRWGGIALGAVLPVAIVAGAEMAQRGWLPTGGTTVSDLRVSMFEVLPAMLALGPWPLIALMSAAQAFGGDRADGTDGFLLERPVSRTSIWQARACASFGTVMVAIAATAAIGALSAYVSGSPSPAGWWRWLTIAGLGLGIALLAWIGGAAAASLLNSPLAAVLAGAVVGAIPVVLGVQLTAMFAHVRIGLVPFGAALCTILLPAFVVASWFATSRGEPAGRGRVKRGLGVACGAVLAVPIFFAAAAPGVLRIDAGRGLHGILPNEKGTAAVVTTEEMSGGWLVAVPSGRKLRFLPPPLRDVEWSADGATLAVVTWAGALGSDGSDQRVEFIDADRGSLVRSVPMPRGHFTRSLVFAGDEIVAILYDESAREPTSEVYVLRKGSTEWKATGFRRARAQMEFLPAFAENRVLIQMTEWVKTKDGVEPATAHVYPVDVAAATVGAEIRSERQGEVDWIDRWGGRTSPSGRYEIARDVDGGGYRIVEAATGAIVKTPSPTRVPRWLAGDRLAWVEHFQNGRTLVVADVGGIPSVVRRWPEADLRLAVSPDRTSLLVSVRPNEAPQRDDAAAAPLLPSGLPAENGNVPEEIVYLPGPRRVVVMAPSFGKDTYDQRATQWAGPNTLARIAPGVVAFEDLDAPGKRRFVLGSARDLK